MILCRRCDGDGCLYDKRARKMVKCGHCGGSGARSGCCSFCSPPLPRLAVVGYQSWAGLTHHPVLVLEERENRAVAVHLDSAFRWREGQVKYRIPLYAVRYVEGPLSIEQANMTIRSARAALQRH